MAQFEQADEVQVGEKSRPCAALIKQKCIVLAAFSAAEGTVHDLSEGQRLPCYWYLHFVCCLCCGCCCCWCCFPNHFQLTKVEGKREAGVGDECDVYLGLWNHKTA